MKLVNAGVLEIAYHESGPTDGPPVILLHGFPYAVHAYDEVASQLAAKGQRCLVPYLRGYGPTRFLHPHTPRSGEQAALGADLLAFLDALNIERATLVGYDWGGRAACVVAALWPDRVTGLVSCAPGYNIQDIARAGEPASPEAEHRLWYQYYLHGERGRQGLADHRNGFCKLLWQLWSPTWDFSDEVFEQSAASWVNPEFVDVVVHSYRHRFGLVAGDPAYGPIQEQLAAQPTISVPSIVLVGGDDGVRQATLEDADAGHFSGPYRRQIVPGVGHNFPQEAPQVIIEAVMTVAFMDTVEQVHGR